MSKQLTQRQRKASSDESGPSFAEISNAHKSDADAASALRTASQDWAGSQSSSPASQGFNKVFADLGKSLSKDQEELVATLDATARWQLERLERRLQKHSDYNFSLYEKERDENRRLREERSDLSDRNFELSQGLISSGSKGGANPLMFPVFLVISVFVVFSLMAIIR
jgi:hypothetical protein